MPPQTNTDRIIDLEKLGATVMNRLDQGDKRTNEISSDQKEVSRVLNEHYLRYEREIVTLKLEIDNLKKWKDEQKKDRDEQARRWWSFGPNLTAAIITILLAPVSVIAWNYFIHRFASP